MSRPGLGPTKPTIQRVVGALSLGIKWPGCEADCSSLCSAKVKNVWSSTSTFPYVFMSWHRDNFTFYPCLIFNLQNHIGSVEVKHHAFLALIVPGGDECLASHSSQFLL
jgi:hypothetical protein